MLRDGIFIFFFLLSFLSSFLLLLPPSPSPPLPPPLSQLKLTSNSHIARDDLEFLISLSLFPR